jgi:transposase
LAQLADDDNRRQQRDREIVALWLKGDRSKNAIAQEFGVSYAVVAEVIARHQRGLEPPAEAG